MTVVTLANCVSLKLKLKLFCHEIIQIANLMMTSSIGNIFRATDLLWEEFSVLYLKKKHLNCNAFRRYHNFWKSNHDCANLHESLTSLRNHGNITAVGLKVIAVNLCSQNHRKTSDSGSVRCILYSMKNSHHENVYLITEPLWVESIGDRRVPGRQSQ